MTKAVEHCIVFSMVWNEVQWTLSVVRTSRSVLIGGLTSFQVWLTVEVNFVKTDVTALNKLDIQYPENKLISLNQLFYEIVPTESTQSRLLQACALRLMALWPMSCGPANFCSDLFSQSSDTWQDLVGNLQRLFNACIFTQNQWIYLNNTLCKHRSSPNDGSLEKSWLAAQG